MMSHGAAGAGDALVVFIELRWPDAAMPARRLVVISGPFSLFLLRKHFITEKKFKKNPAM